jgi:predicted Ser/Thr protein kinase/predicted esterase
MNDNRWQRIEEIFHRAADLAPEARSAFLEEACGSDQAMRQEVESLLAHESEEGMTFAGQRDDVPQTIAHYRISGKLGQGGMGAVYRATDTKLGREVAIKILPRSFAEDSDRMARFAREAKVLASLNHPNIAQIYGLEERALVMELVPGETLKQPLPPETALNYAKQIAEALEAAHKKGIVHRDLKPANIVVTPEGIVKLLDFGLAAIAPGAASTGSDLMNSPTNTILSTHPGMIMGTAAYMSPEQAAGKPVDQRSDIFAFGVVLYGMLTGLSAFQRESTISTIAAVLHEEPKPIREFVKDVPDGLERIIQRCLRKRPEERYASMAEIERDLEECRALAFGSISGINLRALVFQSKRPRVFVPALAILLAVGSLAGWGLQRDLRVRWARNQVPEIGRLVDAGELVKAAKLTREARTVLPADPVLERFWMQTTGEVSIASVPSGAEVSFRPYRGDPNVWDVLGKTPVKKVRIPRDGYVWRLVKPGFAPRFHILNIPSQLEPGTAESFNVTINLRSEKSVPAEMVVVNGGDVGLAYPSLDAPDVSIDDFLIDRHEVTNEQYKQFVDAGGYQRREFWKQPFVKNGKTISWETAVGSFRDSTGRPGPSTWEVGSYRRGMEQHPVAGASWYEAAAYAEFAGKSLPTAYHWTRASQLRFISLIAPGSNFRGEGTQPVGSTDALSGSGTTDMAGNVKEWCLNEGRAGMHFILGGGFDEPAYTFNHTDQQPSWDRRPNFGLRCVRLDSPASAEAAARIEVPIRDYSKDKPVSNDVFKAYKAMYVYDTGELAARVEETEAMQGWTREKISFNAAYNHERVIAYFYLPRHGLPPFQTIVFFPGAGAMLTDKLDLPNAELSDRMDFLLKSGRAVIFPIYKGFYERRDGLEPGGQPPASFRDHVIAWSKDLGRSIDYLESRKEIDSTKVAFFGFSLGGNEGPILAAVESRIKVMILSSGGLQFRYDLPEVDPFNFVSHVTIPVLMLNGRYDQNFPMEASQLPIFRGLGTPAKDKKHVIYDGGHGAFPRPIAFRECLDWLDKHLGPVQR